MDGTLCDRLIEILPTDGRDGTDGRTDGWTGTDGAPAPWGVRPDPWGMRPDPRGRGA